MACGCGKKENGFSISGILQRLNERRNHRRRMLALYAEVEKNLEAYYVMFQLGRLRLFHLDVLERVRFQPGMNLGPAFQKYAEALGQYQQWAKDFKDFEQWYAADDDRKNQSNARIVHEKKEKAQEGFDGLETIIKNARLELRIRLTDQRILKA